MLGKEENAMNYNFYIAEQTARYAQRERTGAATRRNQWLQALRARKAARLAG